MADRVHRVTLFKVPKPEDQQKLVEQYKMVNATNQRNGKPYILSLVVGPAEADQRSQGFTVVAKSEFDNIDDMNYFDEECQAHQALKVVGKNSLTIEGITTVYFKPQVMGGVAA